MLKSILRFVVSGVFPLGLLLLVAAPTFAATTTRQQASVVQPHYHVLSISATGQLQDQVVSQAQFLQVRDQAKQRALQQASTNPTVVPLTNRVSDAACASRSDFWKLWNNTTIANGICFASAGTININVYYVYEVDTGNNEGNFVADGIHFPGDGRQYCAYDYITFTSPWVYDVTQVSISSGITWSCD
jgi:hypothetical protein